VRWLEVLQEPATTSVLILESVSVRMFGPNILLLLAVGVPAVYLKVAF